MMDSLRDMTEHFHSLGWLLKIDALVCVTDGRFVLVKKGHTDFHGEIIRKKSAFGTLAKNIRIFLGRLSGHSSPLGSVVY